MNFDVCGPFIVPRTDNKAIIDQSCLTSLQLSIERDFGGLTTACGCYVFSMHAGKGYKPWYVGQTKVPKLFWEAFSDGKVNLYNTVINKGSGTPVVMFIPTLTKGGDKYRKPNKLLKSIDYLEKWLIGEAFQKNPKLLNIQNTKFLKGLHIRGVFNAKQGEAHPAAKELKRMLW